MGSTVTTGRVALLLATAAMATVAFVAPATGESLPSTRAGLSQTTPTSAPTSGAPTSGAPVGVAVPSGTPAGNDISWTQCSVAQGGYANPMPADTVTFVVIGLSQGQAFSTNPCLADQVGWAKARHVKVAGYVFPTYPSNAEYAMYGVKGPYSRTTVEGRLMNVGYQEAAYWVAAARAAGLATPMVWVDIEKKNRGNAWSPRVADRNLPLIRGVLAGFKRAGYRTGIYTTASHWTEITGGVRLGQPEWRTVGKRTPAEALATCGKPGVQGSPVLMAQYWSADGTVDTDLLCPITRGNYLRRYFHQY